MSGTHSFPTFAQSHVSGLPDGWIDQVMGVVERFAVDAVLVGGQSTSLEESGVNLPYKLVTGDVISDELPWLDVLYRTEFTAMASTVAGVPMVPSSSVVNGVNINVLVGRGARYENHLDSNPLTGVLFVTAHDSTVGGQLVFEPRGGDRVVVDPRPGVLALFDAREIPHSVTPLLADQGMRVSIPMNFFRADEGELRPEGLDDYLYANVATRRPGGTQP